MLSGSIDIPGEIAGGMSGETHRGILEKFSRAIHDHRGKLWTNSRRNLSILPEVSVKISEEIMGGILEALLGTKPETITIGTFQDAHGRIHEGETPGEVPCGISERIPEEVPE